jgi:hypothetical protein
MVFLNLIQKLRLPQFFCFHFKCMTIIGDSNMYTIFLTKRYFKRKHTQYLPILGYSNKH